MAVFITFLKSEYFFINLKFIGFNPEIANQTPLNKEYIDILRFIKPNNIEIIFGIQTIYAKYPGSVAAPTAGLHFTNDLMTQIKNIGAKICYITLHIGLGTFRPVQSENIHNHTMHSEKYSISIETQEMICPRPCRGLS